MEIKLREQDSNPIENALHLPAGWKEFNAVPYNGIILILITGFKLIENTFDSWVDSFKHSNITGFKPVKNVLTSFVESFTRSI